MEIAELDNEFHFKGFLDVTALVLSNGQCQSFVFAARIKERLVELGEKFVWLGEIILTRVLMWWLIQAIRHTTVTSDCAQT